MTTWNVSTEIKKRILDILKELDNDKRVLFILKNLGPQKFTRLGELCKLSRSTVSKYLKSHLDQRNIEKKIYSDKNIQETRYFITQKGETKLTEEGYGAQENLFYINELHENLSKLSPLIEFYKEIGVPESLCFHIIQIILKIGEKFFLIEQNRDLYYTLLYMFYNSILGQDIFAYKYWKLEADLLKDKEGLSEDITISEGEFKEEKDIKSIDLSKFSGYKLNKSQFIELCHLKSYQLDYFIDKLMQNNLGFFMFIREKDGDEDSFFFHEKDIIGTTTMRLIKDRILEEFINQNLVGEKSINELDKIAEEVADELKIMGLIWQEIQEEFEMLIEKLFIKTARDFGIAKNNLKNLIVTSDKLIKSKEGINSLINIINGSDNYEDINIVSISETREISLDSILEDGQGFCPNCGKIILKQDLTNKCSKCEKFFKPEKLLQSIDAAKKASKLFKQEQIEKEQSFPCPNPKCTASVGSDWEECPVCHFKLVKMS